MRILHFITGLGSGGAEKLLYDMALKLKEKDYDIHIVAIFKKNNFYNEELEKIGIKVTYLSKISKYNIFNIMKLIKLIKIGKYDIIHTHLFPALYYSYFLKFYFKDMKFIYTEHSTNNKRRNKWFLKRIEKAIYQKFDKIICISQEVEETLRQYLGRYDNKIKTITNGINIEEYRNAAPIKRKNLKISTEDKLLIMVGRFDKAKDQETVIKAIKLLPDKFKLILVGDGNLIQKNKELSNRLKLDNRVFFLGNRKDVKKLFKTSDIAILSSNWEGFGLAAVESIAAGLPTLGTNVKGLRQIIDDNDLLFEVGDSKNLASKILKISNNKLFAEEKVMIQNRKIEKYNLNKTVNNYEIIYNDLIISK